MSLDILKNNRGIAILVSIMVTAILVATSLELNRRVRSAVLTTAAIRDRLTLSHMASSGIHVAMAMLIKDKKETTIDSLQEIWADPEKINQMLAEIPFEDGKLNLTVSDELGKIQVNALVQFPGGHDFSEPQMNLWDRFFRLPAVIDESFENTIDPTEVINSAKDWLDSGDDDAITGLSGAESDYYENLDPPYSCRNGPFTHLNEFGLIKGITPQVMAEIENKSGISRYLSIHGATRVGTSSVTYKGKINLNTAAIPVIAALLPPGNESLAEAIADYRTETSDSKYIHDLSSPTWYKSVPGCSHIVIDPDLLTTSSEVFKIESAAMWRGMQVSAKVIVQRERTEETGKWTCKVLRWKIE